MGSATKRCFLCATQIRFSHVACSRHYKDYLEYKQETWCQELIKLERKQGEIDLHECISTDRFTHDWLSQKMERTFISDEDAKRIRLQENKNKKTRIKQAAEARRKMVEGILSLRFDEEQSYAQIAAKYKLSPDNVRVIIGRNKRKSFDSLED